MKPSRGSNHLLKYEETLKTSEKKERQYCDQETN